jgi:molybdopterin molybdotransferase
MTSILQTVSCLDDYDPDALRVDKANEAVRACLSPITASESVAIRQALGRVLAQDIVPSINVPAHDNSAMDGYALRFSDLEPGETALTEIGSALAGRIFGGKVGAGECVRVMTGAVMPAGTDTVVIQEVARKDGSRVVIPAGQKKAQNVRYAGEDLKAGTAVLRSGRAIAPADLGLIASLGIGEVAVKRRLKVAFFATGDELASIGAPLKEGEVYDSNRYTLHGMLRRMNVDLLDMGVVRDDPDALEAAFRTACETADAVITSGGVSVGEADYTKQIMARLGDVTFWKIAMRPGRPMAFGRINSNGRDALLFGLPGNPVAVMVTFYHFVRAALQRLMGASVAPLPLLRVRSAQAIRKKPGRTEYQRGILARAGDGQWEVRITGQQGSGVLRSMSEANCFIVLGHEQDSVKAGDAVEVMLFDGLV